MRRGEKGTGRVVKLALVGQPVEFQLAKSLQRRVDG